VVFFALISFVGVRMPVWKGVLGKEVEVSNIDVAEGCEELRVLSWSFVYFSE